MKAFKRHENLPRLELKEMFTDVYGGEEPWNIVSPSKILSQVRHAYSSLQKEQREELSGLLKKYGGSWEPWKAELKKYRGEGKELLDA